MPEAMREMAYMDEAVQVAPRVDGTAPRYLLPPRTLAKLVQLADIAPSAVVLDVGPATGWRFFGSFGKAGRARGGLGSG